MVQAILFDLFETLITESGETPRRASSLASDLGIDAELFRVEWKARRQAIVLGRLSFGEALDQICALCGREDNSATERLARKRIEQKAFIFDHVEPQILAVLRQLRKQGIRLCVISNCFDEDVKAWPECVLSSLFDCVLFSFEIHMAKPHPEIYEEACRRLEVDAGETLFIGDGMDELVGAERIGIRSFQALWFLKRWPNFREDSLYDRTLSRVEEVLKLV